MVIYIDNENPEVLEIELLQLFRLGKLRSLEGRHRKHDR